MFEGGEVMALNEVELDILRSIDDGTLINAINTDVLDINKNRAELVLYKLKDAGLIIMEPSNTGLGEQIIKGLTATGSLILENS